MFPSRGKTPSMLSPPRVPQANRPRTGVLPSILRSAGTGMLSDSDRYGALLHDG